jgi:hypothetical protein
MVIAMVFVLDRMVVKKRGVVECEDPCTREMGRKLQLRVGGV